MSLRNLTKWHGAGNDFLVEVVEQGVVPWWTPERVRAVCSRSTGVGADGLLLASVGSDVSMQLFNADGTEAEMSGNGIRCLAAAVWRLSRATWHELKIRTKAGDRTVRLEMADFDHGVGSVEMGVVSLESALAGSLGRANVGNPHVVVADDPQWSVHDRETRALDFSLQVGGANVEFVTVEDARHVTMKVYERGVGWTQACGTGTCAVAGVLHELGMVEAEVTVRNPGGDLTVALHDGQATLTGPVQFVAHVEWLGH